MKIRTRMTLWYAGVLLVSAVIIGGLSWRELREPRGNAEDPGDSLEDVLGLVCGIGIPAIVLSVGGGWWLMRRALAPVAALTQAAEQMNERNLGQPLPRSGNGDELDRLAQVLNETSSRLQDAFNRVRDFTLHASHELKTPLTVLCGETETELRELVLPDKVRESAASRLEELRRLARIVDGLSLLAKADAGLIELKMTGVPLDELVRDSFADAQILAQPMGLKVELAACERMDVQGDANRLRQLLLNLADSAVKYNQRGGTVSMLLRKVDSSAEFAISNTGPGIAPESLPRVFDRFFRGDQAHSNNGADGCGLGLSIAKWIVSAHKGAIRIESTQDQLTTVTFLIPTLNDPS